MTGELEHDDDGSGGPLPPLPDTAYPPGARRVTVDLEGDLDDHPDELPEDVDDIALIALFAEANDPDSPVTVAEVEAQWAEIREGGGL